MQENKNHFCLAPDEDYFKTFNQLGGKTIELRTFNGINKYEAKLLECVPIFQCGTVLYKCDRQGVVSEVLIPLQVVSDLLTKQYSDYLNFSWTLKD